MNIKHTPEPWEVVEGKTLFHIETAHNNPAGAGIAICSLPKSKKADAIRIHACVSACASLNPEAVPEMVKALEAFLPFATTAGEMLDYASLNEGRAAEYDVASQKLRAALTKAKEGQPV